MAGIRQWVAGIVLVSAYSLPIHASGAGCASPHPGRAVVDSILNLDLRGAEQQVSRWAAADPVQPMLDVFRALIEMAKPYVNDQLSREPYWDRALARFERLITTLEPSVEAGEADADAQLALGLAQAYKALIHAGRDQPVRAYRAASAGRSTLERVAGSGANSGDASVVLGMFEVFVGAVAQEHKLALKLFDSSGDPAVGIGYLEQAVERATVFAPEAARLLLMDVGLAEDQLCRYEALALEMYRRYPGNRPIQLLSKIIPLHCRLAEHEGRPVAPPTTLTINAGCRPDPQPRVVESGPTRDATPVRVPAGFDNSER